MTDDRPVQARPSGSQLPAREDHEEIIDRLWRVHDLMQLELHERRARASTMFAVAAAITVSLTAAGLTGSLRDVTDVLPPAVPAYLGILVYSVVAVIASFFGLNPGLPWERERSLEGIAWALSHVVGATAPKGTETTYRNAYDGLLGYRLYAAHALSHEAMSASIKAATSVEPDDLALRIRALALQIHQHRIWRRVVSAIVAVQFGLVSLGTITVLSVRLRAEAAQLLAAAGGAVVVVALVLLLSAVGWRGRRVNPIGRIGTIARARARGGVPNVPTK